MPKFFISYSRKDGTEIAVRLEKAILSINSRNEVFFDKSSIPAGEYWERSIRNSIKECDYFLLIISEASHSSEWVRKEVEIARISESETGLKKLFIIKYNNTLLPDFVPTDIQYLELTDNWAVDFYKLMDSIEANPSFFKVEKKITNKDNYCDVVLSIQSTPKEFLNLIRSVEYRFDHEFNQAELNFEKVVLKTKASNNFKIPFWTNQSIVVFTVIYLRNSRQINIITPIEIGIRI